MTITIDLSLVSVLLLLYLSSIIGVIGTVLSENRNPLKASAWVVIVGFIPIIGLLAYLLFGQDQRRLHRISRRFYRRLMQHPLQLRLPQQQADNAELLGHWQHLTKMLETTNGAPLLAAESLEIFTAGRPMYECLLADIQSARRHIHVQAYIFEDGKLFESLLQALIARRKDGVDVRIIYDYLGSYSIDSRRWLAIQRAGIQAYPFLPVYLPLLSSTINYRNHRKVSVIDGTIGYVGGMNFADRYDQGDRLGAWRDTHFRLTGDAVASLQSAFLLDWYVVSRRVVHLDQFFPTKATFDTHSPLPKSTNMPLTQFVLGGPIDKHPAIEQTMIALIARAERCVRIQTPYFLPTEPLLRALTIASLSGVAVEIMLPERGDNRMTSLAIDSYIQHLLECGITVLRYTAGFLHAKIMTIDGSVALIGSANMDFRSLEHNFEISGVIYSSQLTAHLDQIYDHDRTACHQLTLAQWQERRPSQRLGESVMRLFAPLL